MDGRYDFVFKRLALIESGSQTPHDFLQMLDSLLDLRRNEDRLQRSQSVRLSFLHQLSCLLNRVVPDKGSKRGANRRLVFQCLEELGFEVLGLR